jgi:hypothetical protein
MNIFINILIDTLIYFFSFFYLPVLVNLFTCSFGIQIDRKINFLIFLFSDEINMEIVLFGYKSSCCIKDQRDYIIFIVKQFILN